MAVPTTSRTWTGTVTVPRGLLVALTTMLVAALLAVAFLLGRVAGRSEDAVPAPVAEAPPAQLEPASNPPTAARPGARPEPSTPAEPTPARTRPAVTSPPPAPAPEPAPPAEPVIDPVERAAVARYFEEVDSIAGADAGAGDPETLAMALLSQATGGDWSPFDELGDTQRSMRRRLRGVQVPPACLAYHQKMVTLLEAGADLLDDVKQGVQSGNLGALDTLSTTAQRLQVDAAAARRLATAIQQRYDL